MNIEKDIVPGIIQIFLLAGSIAIAYKLAIGFVLWMLSRGLHAWWSKKTGNRGYILFDLVFICIYAYSYIRW